MKSKIPNIQIILSFLFFFSFFITSGQNKLNLSEQFKNENIAVYNRNISLYINDSIAVEMDASPGDGLGILKKVNFSNGIIEVDLLGENNPGKSFIGIAFNIQNDSTYEAIYFRPFNFVAEQDIRKAHMVQYIFHPTFSWRKLRDERTGEFENKINNPPNPDRWFKARIEITDTQVNVFAEGNENPVLSVDRLCMQKSNTIGIWTGHNSSGRFRNLSIN